MRNIPTYESFQSDGPDQQMASFATEISAAVSAACPGLTFRCYPSPIRLGPPPHGLLFIMTMGADRSEYGGGIIENDPFLHKGSISAVGRGDRWDGTVSVELHMGGRIYGHRIGAGAETLKLGWRDFKCPLGSVASKLSAYFAKAAGKLREVLPSMGSESQHVARVHGLLESAGRAVKMDRGEVVMGLLDVVNPEDFPQLAALLKGEQQDSDLRGVLAKEFQSDDRGVDVLLRARPYFAGGGWDADAARLKRAAGDAALRQRIAKEFSRLLLAEIGRESLAEVVRLNGDGSGGTSCASHDFCDPNELMDAAMNKYGYGSDRWPDSAALADHAALWSASWAEAKRRRFWSV